MSDTELEAMIDIARRGAERVAAIYAEHVRSSIAVALKGPNDPVTRADEEANDIIVRGLVSRFPEATVIAEETTPSEADLMKLALGGRVFFVDPLDGTREFVDKNPEFCSMIGLAEDGVAVAGVVAMPDGTVYAGRVGDGAFIDEGGERRELEVTALATFPEARMLVSRSHRPAIIEPLCRRLGVRSLEPCGSVGVKVARMVRAEAELYVHRGPGMKHWDTCGPEALLTAAGGRLSDLHGHAIDYASRQLQLQHGLLASNRLLHPGVLSAVTWAEREADRHR